MEKQKCYRTELAEIERERAAQPMLGELTDQMIDVLRETSDESRRAGIESIVLSLSTYRGMRPLRDLTLAEASAHIARLQAILACPAPAFHRAGHCAL